jgi:DNA-binding MarR family transcriptional regulator
MASDVKNKLERIFLGLKSIGPDLSLPLLLTILVVARRPGLSINDLADELDVPQQTASRYVSVLQGRYQLPGRSENAFAKRPFLALGISTDDSRSRALHLTDEGTAEVRRLQNQLAPK